MTTEFTIPRTINTHCHLRGPEDKNRLQELAAHAFDGGAGTILPMPNLTPGLTSGDKVVEYVRSIKEVESRLRIIPTMMMTEKTTSANIMEAIRLGIRDAKVYPLKRTTNSDEGVRSYTKLLPAIKTAGRNRMRIHFHPEYPNLDMNGRDAEYLFLPVVDMFLHETEATLIWEHGTDGRCVRLWEEFAKSGRFFVTLTAHHLAEHEDGAFGDVRSVCKPPIKTQDDRLALVRLVERGFTWTMKGFDDAPHPEGKKQVNKGNCACGAYTAPFGLTLCAHALDEMIQSPGGEDKFARFVHGNAQSLYQLDEEKRKVTLVRKDFDIPRFYTAGDWKIPSFWAGRRLIWSLK